MLSDGCYEAEDAYDDEGMKNERHPMSARYSKHASLSAISCCASICLLCAGPMISYSSILCSLGKKAPHVFPNSSPDT